MKRIRFDPMRWYCYLHRRERGMPFADDLDDRERRIADEIFCRLYAGELPEVPETDRKGDDYTWAEGVHGALDEVIAKAQKKCVGDARLSAEVAKEILNDLLDESDENSPASGQARDAADGLDGVDTGNGWGGRWKGEAEADERAKKLAERLKDDERLKRIALLAGKFKRLALSKQKTKVKRGADEITDIVCGDQLDRLLPSELARLASPKRRLAAIRDLYERKMLEYEMTSTELLGRGPLVMCLDKSGSMQGDKDVWAIAVALAMLETVHREHRPFILLGFNHDVIQRIVVPPGRPLPEKALFDICGGGTDITKVLDLALHATETKTKMRRADIVIVTDGESDMSRASWIRERAKKNNVRIYGVGIGVPSKHVRPWCDDVCSVENLDGIDNGAAGVLFGN